MREWLSGGAPPCQGGGRGFDPRLALISSMSTLRSGPRSPRSPGPRAPSRACYPLIFSKSFFFMLHQINFYCFTIYR